jgi:TP901 family phage tail tape measure protein
MGIASVAIQFTIIDLLSKGVEQIKGRMQALAGANRDVQQSFDRMTQSAKHAAMAGAATVAMARSMQPAIAAAGGLEAATLKVKGNLAGSAADAKELQRQLREVRATAITVSAQAPFSAEDVVNIENALLKAGVALENVGGKSGAAFAATALATLSGEAPEMIGEAMARIGSQFDLKGGQYGDLADWLVRVDDASATNIPELVQGLRMAGGNAKALNISAKDSVTTLGALAPLGERAGSSFNNMLIGMLGMTREQRALLGQYKLNFFDKGKFIGMDAATSLLRDRFGGIKDDQQRLLVMMKIFGEEGGRAANTLVGAKSGFKEIEKAADKSLSAAQKLDIWAEGFNASMTKLHGTGRTTLALLFTPALAPLTAVGNKLNELLSLIGEFAQKHELVGKAFSGLMYGGLAAGGLAALGYGVDAIRSGRKVLKGVGGFKGLLGSATSVAGGIATGKAVEAATGVQPVFVTNWPSSFGGGAGALADAATGAAAGGWLKNKAGALAKLALPFVASAGIPALVATGTGMVSYRAGQVMNAGMGWVSGQATGGKYGGSGWLGGMLYDALHRTNGRDVKNDINLTIAIDGNGRVMTETSDKNTHTKINTMRRGSFTQTASAH